MTLTFSKSKSDVYFYSTCGRGYQLKAEGDNPYRDLAYSGYHKN